MKQITLSIYVFVASVLSALGPSFASELAESGCLAAEVNTTERSQLQRVIEICTIALGEKDTDSATRASMLLNRGVALRNSGLHESSLQDLSEALSLDPKNPGLYRMRAWTLRESGQPAAAENDYDRAIDLEPEWQGFLSRCVVRFDQEKYIDALSDCEKSLALRRQVDALFFSAYTLHRLGRTMEALPRAQEACDQWDAIAEHFVLLTRIQLALNLRSEAEITAKRATDRFPGDQALKLSLDELGLLN